MDQRLDLHNKLKNCFTTGTPYVYFQPPKNQQMNYPCIVYKLDDMPSFHANNLPYMWNHRYELTVIDRNPESPLRESVQALSTAKMKTSFVKDNLHHFVFSIYN